MRSKHFVLCRYATRSCASGPKVVIREALHTKNAHYAYAQLTRMKTHFIRPPNDREHRRPGQNKRHRYTVVDVCLLSDSTTSTTPMPLAALIHVASSITSGDDSSLSSVLTHNVLFDMYKSKISRIPQFQHVPGKHQPYTSLGMYHMQYIVSRVYANRLETHH